MTGLRRVWTGQTLNNRKYFRLTRLTAAVNLAILRGHFLDLLGEGTLHWWRREKILSSLTFIFCKIPDAGRGGIGQGQGWQPVMSDLGQTIGYHQPWLVSLHSLAPVASHDFQYLWWRSSAQPRAALHTYTQTSGTALITQVTSTQTVRG